MKEQMNEIYGLIKQFCTPSGVPSIPDNFPIEFPLKTREDLQRLEDYLSDREKQNTVSLYLSTLGGDTVTTRTNRILKHVLTNELAKGFNFAGQKNRKEGFAKLHLKTVIIRAVQIKSPSSTEAAIETAIKTWLKHASDRIKEKEKKNNN
ncbi:uncharacterized protein [Temnothorax nylanderi]|uniref:uncharacterized protein n=1 Tax=Temnothorax nylanderi TaxID=102681 RepID=UPI003A8A0CD1